MFDLPNDVLLPELKVLAIVWLLAVACWVAFLLVNWKRREK